MKASRSHPTKRASSCKSFASSSYPRCRLCKCGEELLLLTSKTATNPGRVFWRCKNWDVSNFLPFYYVASISDPDPNEYNFVLFVIPCRNQILAIFFNGLMKRALNKIQRRIHPNILTNKLKRFIERLANCRKSLEQRGPKQFSLYLVVMSWVVTIAVCLICDMCIQISVYGLGGC